MQIPIVAELEKLKIDFETTEQGIKLCCPFHDDKHPSLSIDPVRGSFRCWASGCEAKGNLRILLCRLHGLELRELEQYLRNTYGITTRKTIEGKVIADFHARIFDKEELKKELYNRGINDNDISTYLLGEKNGRVVIPIANENHEFINLRYYLPNAKEKKFVNHRGCGRNALFPIDQLQYDTICIVGGEIKAIVAAKTLNTIGIGAVSTTDGEGSWLPEFTSKVKAKKIYVALDADESGNRAAEKLCRLLVNSTDWIGKIEFPDIGIPKMGIDDYIVANKGPSLEELIKNTPKWQFRNPNALEDVEPQVISFADLAKVEDIEKRISVRCKVDAIGETPFLLPKEVEIDCPEDQDFCAACGVCSAGTSEFEVHPEARDIITMAGTNDDNVERSVAKYINIPSRCSVWSMNVKTHYKVEDIRISPELDIESRGVERAMQPAYCVTDNEALEGNETYIFTGRVWSSPKTTEVTAVFSGFERTIDALSSYECKDPHKLQVFNPNEWTVEGIRDRLDEIYEDFEANVTHIFERKEIHLFVDLAYHSVLNFRFDGVPEKGYSEVLIVGDSSLGKSQVTSRLMYHYNLGEEVDCRNASEAGIIGGLQQLNGKWYVTWGTIPCQDKRLVILEELKGYPGLLKAMTHIRTKGIATITKIEKHSAYARSRLVVISNPAKERDLASYSYGVEAVKELIEHNEDLRRFDAVCIVTKDEIDSRLLQTKRPKFTPKFTTDICHELVLWAWTRTRIEFEDESKILEAALRMTDKFVETIPIVDAGSMRFKLARLAAALAARTFSNKNGILFVRNCHVEYIEEFLTKEYSKAASGYLAFSKDKLSKKEVKDEKFLVESIASLPYPNDLVEGLRAINTIDLQSIIDYSGADTPQASRLISLLVRSNAFKRLGKNYVKTECMNHLLRNGFAEKVEKAAKGCEFE